MNGPGEIGGPEAGEAVAAPPTNEAAVDATRRTLLANERTFLAWWRTGVTVLLASLAVGRLLPQVADANETLSAILGVAFALLGAVTIGYGWWRHREVARALRSGEFIEASPPLLLGITGAGMLLAIVVIVLVLEAG